MLRGGKRLRPAFVYYGYKAFGGTDEEGIIRAAISVELVHAGALVHDDIMDNSDLRRGKPTVHRVFGDRFASSEIGRSVGIVAGDTILALSGKALSSINVPSERLAIARKFLDKMCGEINIGQYLDVLGNLLPEVDEDWIMKVLEYKTARYTVEKPILIGAVLAGADLPFLSKLSEFGISVGIAFQIQDDILGMYGDEKKVGKPFINPEEYYPLYLSSVVHPLYETQREFVLGLFKGLGVSIDDITTLLLTRKDKDGKNILEFRRIRFPKDFNTLEDLIQERSGISTEMIENTSNEIADSAFETIDHFALNDFENIKEAVSNWRPRTETARNWRKKILDHLDGTW